MIFQRFFLVATFCCAVAACESTSGGDSFGGAGSVDECVAMYEAVCEKACACGEGYCFSFGDVSASYNSNPDNCMIRVEEEDCAKDALQGRDFKGCISALDQAQCAEDTISERRGVELPYVCSYAICKLSGMDC